MTERKDDKPNKANTIIIFWQAETYVLTKR